MTSLGTLNTSTGFAKIQSISGGSDTNNQIIIIDGTNGYSYNVGTGVATFPIADGDFPQDCIDLVTQDDYAIAINKNSVKYNISNLANSIVWEALDFASKINNPDPLVGAISHASKLVLFGDESTEVWYNGGDSDFPFAQYSDVLMHFGCAAKGSIVKNESYFVFLGKNPSGGYSVHLINPQSSAYNPIPISTKPIDQLIGSLTSVSDAIAYIYTIDGHSFYDITFPTDGITLTCDIPRGDQADGIIWTKKSSLDGISQTRYRANCYAFCYGKRFVGDFNSGKIYYLDNSTYTEDGTTILRQFISPPLFYEGKRILINKLQIDVETGVGSNKTFTLEKSMDNGSTWTTVNTYTIPDKGGRIYTGPLGSSRYGILFRIQTTMDAKFILLGFQAEFKICHN
ncbi:MAG TPA: hypothetical protein VGK47_14425 [Nitrososphaeraceae archaeon]